MPPGFATQCPYGLELPVPITPWITAEWVTVYALCVETALLGLGLLILRRQGTVGRGAAVSLLLVTGCAVGALSTAWWMTNRDIQGCFAIPFSPHPTLAQDMQAQHLYAELLTQAQMALGVLAVVFIFATTLTDVTLVRGWRERRRAHAAA